MRIKDTDSRIHFDSGVTDLGGEKINLYGSLGFSRDFSSYNLKLGFSTLFKEFNTDNRLRITHDHNVAWYHKTLIKKDNIRFGFIGVLDITKQLIAKKDFLFGVVHKDWDFILKAEQDFKKMTKDWSKPADWFSNISLTAIFNQSKSKKYALSVEVDPSKTKENILATALVEYKYNDQSFTKVSLNSNALLSVLVKKTLDSTWSLSGGAQIPIPSLKEGKPKFGVQVDVNM